MLRPAFFAAVTAVVLLGHVVVSRPTRELDTMCLCYPCGNPCVNPSPPPPDMSYTPPPPDWPYTPPSPDWPPLPPLPPVTPYPSSPPPPYPYPLTPPMTPYCPPSPWGVWKPPPLPWWAPPEVLYPQDPGYHPSAAGRNNLRWLPAIVGLVVVIVI